MTCPELQELLDGSAAEHVAACEGCRAVAELAALRTEPLSCGAAEALMGARATVGLAPGPERALLAHLEECADCLRVARDLYAPVVVEILAGLSEGDTDFPELGVVAASNYVRGKEIGRGGMGRIVRARDRRLGRAVAIKELIDERLRARFENEARLTARLQHPAIVSVHEAGRWPTGEPFYAMKLVAGRPLDQVIAGLPTLAERLALLPNLTTVVEAIAYAHSERVVHRDLKPHNILIGPFGETVVIDWGLAKDLSAALEDSVPYRGEHGTLTAAGAGTPAYMPPEQARGEPPDERVDVFALGATLHHLLSGRPPGERKLPDEVPRELSDIVAKATAPSADLRYRTAAELAGELRRFQNGQLVAAHRYSAAELARRWLRRHKAVVAVSAACLLALAGGGAVSFSRVVAARGRAEASAHEAGRALADILVERGRQELLDGSPARALPFLHAALERGLDTPPLRFLLAEAGRSTEALVASIPAAGAGAIALSPDGTRLIAGPRIIDVASGSVLATLEGDVTAATFDPEGKLLATGGTDGTVRLWDAGTWKLRAALVHRSSRIGGVRFAAGRVLTWAGSEAEIWDLDGRHVANLIGHERDVESVELDPAGRRALTAGADGTARVWDAATGALRLTISGNKSGLAAATFDPKGERIATAGWDNRARLFDAADGRELGALDLGESVKEIGFSPDGKRILLHGAWNVKLWDGKTATPFLSGTSIGIARFSNDGERVFTSAADGTVKIWDLDVQPRGLLEGHVGRVAELAESDDGRRIASLGVDGTVKVWDARAAEHDVAELPSLGVESAGFIDAERLLTVGGAAAQLWDARTGRLLASVVDIDLLLHHGGTGPRNPGGQLLADGRIVIGRDRIWDPASGRIESRELDLPWQDLNVGPGGTLASCCKDGLELRDVATGELRRHIQVGDMKHGFAFSRDGRIVALIDPDHVLHRWEIATGEELPPLPMPPRTDVVALGPGLVFAFGDETDGHLLDMATGRELSAFRGHTDRITSATFSSDGTRLLTQGADHTARLWDVTGAQVLTVLPLPPGHAVSALSPDGERALIGGGSGGGARLVDLHVDRRAPAEIAAGITERVPFALEDWRVVPRALPATIATRPARPYLPRPAWCVGKRVARGAPFPHDLGAFCTGGGETRLDIWWPSGAKLAERTGERMTFRSPLGMLLATVDGQGPNSTVTVYGPDGKRTAQSVFEDHWIPAYTSFYPSGAVHERSQPASPEYRYIGTYTVFDESGRKTDEGLYHTFRGGWPGSPEARVGTWTHWDDKGVASEVQYYRCPITDEEATKMHHLPRCR